MWEQFSLCRNFIAATKTKGELCVRINEENIILKLPIFLNKKPPQLFTKAWQMQVPLFFRISYFKITGYYKKLFGLLNGECCF
jgi:hypothetical protein